MAKNPDHQNNIVALRRIEGQVRGVQRMVEDREYCIDILNQIHAVKGALSRVEEKILQKHFQHCVTAAIMGSSEKQKQQKLDEILELINRTRRG
jgi:DNA-binding FrmR family transcriptional regulator